MNEVLVLLLLASILLNGWFVWKIILPLRRLARQAGAVSEGNLSAFDAPCAGNSDLQTLQRAVQGLVGHVRRAQAQARQVASAVDGGQEAERKRIAHELHDDTVQALIAIAQTLEFAGAMAGTENDELKNLLRQIRAETVETVDNVRRLIGDLRPPALDELGLSAALRMLADQLSGAPVRVEVRGNERRLPDAQELALFRAVQEAVRNALAHASAASIGVQLHYRRQDTYLVVQDDGHGFDTSRLQNPAAGHFGLIGMRERVEALNGKLDLQSTLGQGTRIAITLPLPDAVQPQNVVRDPVCHAMIEPERAYGSLVHAGSRYFFCCPVCQGSFQRDPDLYLSPVSAGANGA